MKQHEVLGFCPICEQKLQVTQLSCHGCKTQINGQYQLNLVIYLKNSCSLQKSFKKIVGI